MDLRIKKGDRKMKKSILFIILGVVTLGCIIYGSVKYVGGGIKSLKQYGISIETDDFDDDSDIREVFPEKNSSINRVLDSFSSIKIDVSIMDLTVEEGKEFKVNGFFNRDYLNPSVSVENGVLEVKQLKKRVFGLPAGNNSCRMVITIPSGTSLSDVNISSNVGDIKIRDLNAKDLDLECNVGEISVRKVNFEELNCNTNVGEIDIYQNGNLEEYTIKVNTDVGEVTVDGSSYKRSYNSKGSTSKRIIASTNVGEINLR